MFPFLLRHRTWITFAGIKKLFCQITSLSISQLLQLLPWGCALGTGHEQLSQIPQSVLSNHWPHPGRCTWSEGWHRWYLSTSRNQSAHCLSSPLHAAKRRWELKVFIEMRSKAFTYCMALQKKPNGKNVLRQLNMWIFKVFFLFVFLSRNTAKLQCRMKF